jgi:hypothetical protein
MAQLGQLSQHWALAIRSVRAIATHVMAIDSEAMTNRRLIFVSE